MKNPIFLDASRSVAIVVLALAAFGVRTPACGQATREPPTADSSAEAEVREAVDGVLAAFGEHPLVALSDAHGLAEEMAFYEAVVQDPRFAREVRNVVVEFGGAGRQDVIDRYVTGELVPYQELREVWTDTVGWIPTVPFLGYGLFFARIRETNLALPADQRIRVWLGEPAINWKAVETREQYREYLRQRDSHAAELIRQQILDRDRKALVIYGGTHFHAGSDRERVLWEEWAAADPEAVEPFATSRASLLSLVEADRPDAFFVVQVYTGFQSTECTTGFEQRFEGWSMPALVTRINGTTLERDARRCLPRFAGALPPGMSSELQEFFRTQISESILLGDAILFLGRAAALTQSPLFPDILLDEGYRAEISRQMEIKTGQPLPPSWGRERSVIPVPFNQ